VVGTAGLAARHPARPAGSRRPVRRGILAAAVAALSVAAAAPAAAPAAVRRSTSSNWAGYAVSRAGTSFKRVSATWVQPAVTCAAPARSSSAYWVGLGGYHTGSQALEQVGTEADCDATGAVHYSSWYELVPASSVRTPVTIHAGDEMFASVTVTGHAVRVALSDRTTSATYTRTLRPSRIDTTSAEWIAEAPSVCFGAGACFVEPLASFGSMTFASARATSTSGHTGPISDGAWAATAIDLAADQGRPPFFPGHRFAAAEGRVQATAQPLAASGDSFAVTTAAAAE
jgi:Peptidase A4 family